MNHRGITAAKIILILIGVLVVGFAVQRIFFRPADISSLPPNNAVTPKPFFATPKPTVETSGWKTYRDERYGFEISYPSGLPLEYEFKTYYHLGATWRSGAYGESKGNPIISIPVYRVENADSYPRYFAVELRIGASSDPEDLKKCYDNDQYNTTESPEIVVINGVQFRKFLIDNRGMMQYLAGVSYRTIHGQWCIAVEQLKAGSAYHEDSRPDDIPDEVLNSYYDRILDIVKTFKFTR